jgi:hypothetical protein
VTVDHLRAIKDARYRARIRRRIGGAARPGLLLDLRVMHEHDDSCCRLESWPKTYRKLFGPLIAETAARSPGDVDALLAEHEPSIIVIPRSSYGSTEEK